MNLLPSTTSLASTVSSEVSAKIIGSTTPRLWTAPLVTGDPGPCGCGCALTPETSWGFEFNEWCDKFIYRGKGGMMPWQRWAGIHILELDMKLSAERGYLKLRFDTVLIMVGRQSGKTELVRNLALWMMVTGRAEVVLGGAQNLQTARKPWEQAEKLLKAYPLSRRHGKTVHGNGKNQHTLKNGSTWSLTATNSKARGDSVDLLIMDEVREYRDDKGWTALSATTNARPNGLRILISNAGDDESIVLNKLQASGRLAIETGEYDEDDALGLFEWSAEQHEDVMSEEAWAKGIPAYGYTQFRRDIMGMLKNLTETGFRTEVLCQHVETLETPLVSVPQWDACRVSSIDLRPLRGVVCLGVDVAMDRDHASIYAAAWDEASGKVIVDQVAAFASGRELMAELPSWIEKIKPRKVAWLGGAGPIQDHKVELEKMKLGRRLVAVPSGEMSAVCQGFVELVHSGRMAHDGSGLLTNHVIESKKWNRGDGWVFVRKGVGPVDALYAAAAAVHIARQVRARTVTLALPREDA